MRSLTQNQPTVNLIDLDTLSADDLDDLDDPGNDGDVAEENVPILPGTPLFDAVIDRLKYIADPSPGTEPVPEPPWDAISWPMFKATDMGNGERLARYHGEDLHYIFPWKKWLVWDGRRWHTDDTGEIDRRAKLTALTILFEAGKCPKEAICVALSEWATKSQSVFRRKAMIESARSEDGIPILPNALDADPWLLNVANGTIDLRTGKRREHRRADLLTKISPVRYDPDATCPTWDAFLERIMAGNADLIAFLQRAVGYSLTGSTREQCFFVLHGSGANGKSTLLEAVRHLLADYAQRVPTETLMVKKYGGGIPNDVARLRGARFATASETELGRRLAESLVKELTGGDTIAARFLYGEYFEFVPQFKLWLSTNHKPQIRGTDDAIWRRVRLVPFGVTIPPAEQDRDLGEKLAAELPGILAWAVQGCLDWQRQGLNPPREVIDATNAYRAEQDVIGGFLAQRCVQAVRVFVSVANLYAAYSKWTAAQGIETLSGRFFGDALAERGFVRAKRRHVRGWKGIGLLADVEEQALLNF